MKNKYSNNDNVIIAYTCPNCEEKFGVSLSKYYPAKLNAPPEDCYPAEGGNIEPTECECGTKVNYGTICEAADAKGEPEPPEPEEWYRYYDYLPLDDDNEYKSGNDNYFKGGV